MLASTDSSIPNQDLTYVYDNLGNRIRTIENGVTKAYTTNNLNQYTKVGDTTYVFDLDGNLQEERAPGGTTIHTFNDENRLVGIASETGNVTYTDDAFGNRVATTENGQATNFVVDPTVLGNVVGEYDAAGGRLAGYDYGYGLLSRNALGNVTSYTFDAIGNTHGLVDSNHALVSQYTFNPVGGQFGNIPVQANRFVFMGEFGVIAPSTVVSTGYAVRARNYDTNLGRFCSEDPGAYREASYGRYHYTRNSFQNGMDPDGLKTIIISTPWICGSFSVDLRTGKRGACIGFGPGVGIFYDPKGKPSQGVFVGGWGAIIFGGSLTFGGWPPRINGALGYGLGASLGVDFCFPLPPASIPFGLPPPTPPTGPGDGGTTGTTGSGDPNDLVGPGGYGPLNYLPAANILPYRINFENDSTASAPAQQVVVTDPLNPHLDWSTFELTEIGFGDQIIPIPPDSQYFETRYECTIDGHDLAVDIFAGIDLGTGQAFCRFYTIDPATELPPTVDIGFLPPEDGTGRGQGHFSFVIKAKPGLPAGTAIRNIAHISFDGQPIIATNQIDPHNPGAGTDPNKEALVTLDDGPPTLTLTLTPTGAGGTNIDVRWLGDDRGGVGIVSYDVEVSLNGGAFEAWQTDTQQTQATYPGYFGQQLQFRVNTADFLGQQATPATATTVIIDDDYLHWRAAIFGTAVGDPAQRNALWSDDADPDTDGRSNLYEFLAATDPLLADAQFNPTTRTEGGVQIYRYRLTKVANHLVDHYIQWSPDGVHWFTGGLVFRIVEDHADYWLMEAVLALNGQPPVQFRQVAKRDVVYSHWIYEEGAAFSQRGQYQDPNGDRIPNAVAYALGLPAVGPVPAADLARLPKAVLERTSESRGGIVLGLPERMQPDVALSIEASPGLTAGTWAEVARRTGTGAWQLFSARHPAVRTQRSGGVEVTTFTEDLAAQRFYRLRAEV
ncbi:MAG: hypothetical protein NTW21_31620, partial [Verrucomicrobia bacterium]|nr:hypothetical protein [Verrucomicrobiota bacterium]